MSSTNAKLLNYNYDYKPKKGEEPWTYFMKYTDDIDLTKINFKGSSFSQDLHMTNAWNCF